MLSENRELFIYKTNFHLENLVFMNRKMLELKVTFQTDPIPQETQKCSNSESRTTVGKQGV